MKFLIFYLFYVLQTNLIAILLVQHALKQQESGVNAARFRFTKLYKTHIYNIIYLNVLIERNKKPPWNSIFQRRPVYL